MEHWVPTESAPPPLIGDKAELERITGKKLPPELFEFEPCGCRVLVTRCPADEETQAGIVIPEAARDDEGLGWVLAVGPSVNDGSAPYPAGHLPIRHPGELVGMKVMYRAFTGQAVRCDAGDRTYESEFEMIPDNAIMAIVRRK